MWVCWITKIIGTALPSICSFYSNVFSFAIGVFCKNVFIYCMFVIILAIVIYVMWFIYKAIDECDPHGPPSDYI